MPVRRLVEAPPWQRMTSAKLGSASPRPDHGPRGSDQGEADAGCNNSHKTLEYASPRNSSPPAGPLINVWRSLLPTTAPADAQRASVSEDDSEDDELIADLDNLLLIPEAIRSTPPPLRPSQVPPLRCPGSPSASSTIFGSPRLLLPKLRRWRPLSDMLDIMSQQRQHRQVCKRLRRLKFSPTFNVCYR
jgi:hypothetical protein